MVADAATMAVNSASIITVRVVVTVKVLSSGGADAVNAVVVVAIDVVFIFGW